MSPPHWQYSSAPWSSSCKDCRTSPSILTTFWCLFPTPCDVSPLKAFLGKINIMPNFSPISPCPWRLCRYIHGENVLTHSGCTPQVAQSAYCAKRNITSYHPKDESYTCHTWPTQNAHNRQWHTLYKLQMFLEKNGIRHVKTAPYHPATNGLVERAVQTFRAAMKKSTNDVPVEMRVSRFLFHY